MRYLYVILAIVCFVSALLLFGLLSNRQKQPEDIALTVNGHSISEASLRLSLDGSSPLSYHQQDRNEAYQTIITREILIQEAKKQGIDQEESFRIALKNYYESSLIKILLDRKNEELKVEVTPEETARYIDLIGSQITFTRLDKVPADAEEARTATGVTTTAQFDDLADSIKLLLATLQPGQFATRFDTGSDIFAIRLDSISISAQQPLEGAQRKIIESMIREFKKEQAINHWLMQLAARAKVTIYKSKADK